MATPPRSRTLLLALPALLTLAACQGAGASATSLDWLLGDWSGTRRDTKDGTAAQMSVQVRALADGPGQIERVQVEGEGQAYVGVAVRVPTATAGQWEMSYVNASRETIARLEGQVAADKATWRSVTPGRTREGRVEVERLGPDRWRRTQWVSEDGGQTWQVLFTDEVRRKQ